MKRAVSSRLSRGVLTVTLTRPAKLNALTLDTLDELEACITAARAAKVRVLLLRGEGTSFCSGADVVSELGQPSLGRAGLFLRRLATVLRDLSALPKPVVAAVQGHAAGGGAELALAADLRVVGEGCELWFPDVALGSTPASLWHLVRYVGKAKATSMVMLQERLNADEMLRWGVCQDVVPVSQLQSASLGVAARLSELSPDSLRFAKETIRLASEGSHEAELAANVAAMLACHADDHQRLAVRRFRTHGGD